MSIPDNYRAKRGDVVIVRATVTHVMADEDGPWVVARTGAGKLVRASMGDLTDVESMEIRVGDRVRWWSAGSTFSPPGYVYGEVLAVDSADGERSPKHDNLWVKHERLTTRSTIERHNLQRA